MYQNRNKQLLLLFLRGWGYRDFRYVSSIAIGTTDRCRRILSVFFLIIVVQNLSYCFDSLQLL